LPVARGSVSLPMITFKPQQVTQKILDVLNDRTKDVLEKRYQLVSDAGTKNTLESIGQTYGITRERVRQIENCGLNSARKSDFYKDYKWVFDELSGAIDSLGGGVVSEEQFLSELTEDAEVRNHLYFLLVLGHPFTRSKENVAYTHRWHTDRNIVKAVENALQKVHDSLDRNELVSETEILNRFRNQLAHAVSQHDKVVLRRWLEISKAISKNPLGEWGQASSPNVRAKGVRDYAYLAVKQHGSPMHFREVAESIESLFNRRAHTATCHNELIKDPRFVLVGRGLYALTEWGYSAGVVKDVLIDLLKRNGPLTREEIIDKVRKERYVKDNTIVVNLQDSNIFKRLNNGSYILID